MELYKGYIVTKNKEAAEKFKNRNDLKSYDQVKALPEFAGILADDAVLIDIDDKAQSEILMHIVEDMQLLCKVYESRSGMHFLFRNNGSITKCYGKTKLACGLSKIDIKAGCKNSYEVLKIEGKERPLLYDILEGEEYQEVPKFLLPVATKEDFVDMEAGDGRNNSLYSYILTLNNAGLTKDEAREVINIINKYVLTTPLSEEELNVILRDEAFPKETFFKNNAFLHNNFALFLKNNEHIKRIEGQLHIYRDGVYIPGARIIESMMIKHLPMLKASQRTEVLKYLEIICPFSEQTVDANMIAFNNGIYNLATDTLQPFDPDIIITNKIPWDYDMNAYSEVADDTFNKLACHDDTIRDLLEECIGYCFYRRNEMSKAFILTGEKSNGKSTFLDMVKNVLGSENYSALDLSELDERFSTSTMSGKLANIGDDISDEFLQGKAVSTLKKIVSGNQVKAEFKGQDTFFFKPCVKLMFSANDIPRIRDKTGAVLRRLVIVPFNARFSKDDPDFDPYITWKLRDEEVMEYVIRLGVDGLKRVLTNNEFTQSEKVEKEMKDYELQNNPILLFLQDRELNTIENQPTKEVYRSYQVACAENGSNEMCLSSFSKALSKRLNLVVQRKRINGKLIGVYVKGLNE